jgi:hypothetical protein
MRTAGIRTLARIFENALYLEGGLLLDVGLGHVKNVCKSLHLFTLGR